MREKGKYGGLANCIERVWLDDETQWLDEHAGRMPLPELTAELNRLFGHRRPVRTASAVTQHANDRGLSVEYLEGFTMQQLAEIVGCNGQANTLIHHHWIKPGLLSARKVYGKGKLGECGKGRWQILQLDFERFLQEHPYAYDWRRFSPGPWRSRAELIARRSPWKTIDEMLQILDVKNRNVWESRCHRIPHKRRHHKLGGVFHPDGEPMIHMDEILKLRDEIAPLISKYVRRSGANAQHRQPKCWRRTCHECSAMIFGRPDEPKPERCAFCDSSIRRKEDPALSITKRKVKRST
jgi:hypothetical protein